MTLLLFTIMSISAVVYVAFNKSLIANSIWSISNIGFIWYNIIVSEYEMVLLFSVYEITALYGVYNLGIKPYWEKEIMAKIIDMSNIMNAEMQHEIDAIEISQKWHKWCKKARAEGIIK